MDLEGLLRQCQDWHESQDYERIVEALEGVPPGQRTTEVDMELARAYNNLGTQENGNEADSRRLLRKALGIMEQHEAELSDDYSWNFRMGYSLFFLEREGEALPHFGKALELHPGDDPKYNTREEIQTLIDSCRESMSLPMFETTFRNRVIRAWEEFEREEAEIRRMMDSDRRDEYSDELIRRIQDILEMALDDPTFEFGIDDGKHDLVLVTQGDKVRLFEYVYFRDHAPGSVLENWKITVGRPPRPDFHLRAFDLDVCGDDVEAWVERTEEDRVSLRVCCDKVQDPMDDEDRVWWMLFTIVDSVIGEVANMRHIDSFEVVDHPPEGQPVKLSDLPKAIEDMGIVLTNDAESFLQRYTVYKADPDEESDGPWRIDILSGSNCCPPIINEYYSGERRCVDTLHADGAVAGYLAYSLDIFDGEDRSDRIFDFRDSLEGALMDKAGEDALAVIGGATGLHYGYLDFIAWDLPSVLNAAQDFLADSGVSKAFFRVFATDVPTCIIVNNSDWEGDSMLGPMDIATLESFIGETQGQFGGALAYLLDFIDRGTSEGRFTEEQAQQDLQIALWYSYACINMHQYEYYYKAAQWMPSSMCNASGCGTWFYRYVCALMYCGRLEKALEMAERGTEEEPDYPWAWLLLGELRAHFGDTVGALHAVDRGLEIVPGDYEFETLRREINEGATLDVMLRHWIDPELDADLQAGKEDEDSEALDRAIRCVVLDNAGMERFMGIFGPEPRDWTADDPYCSFSRDMMGRSIRIEFRMNRAGLSKMDESFLENLRGWFDEGRWLRYPFGKPDDSPDILLDTVIVFLDGTAALSYRDPEGSDDIILGLDPMGHPSPPVIPDNDPEGDDSDRSEDGEDDETGVFAGFVLMSRVSWSKRRLIRDLKEMWGIEAEEDDDDSNDDALVFEVDGRVAAVSLMRGPIPEGEAEANAENNYMWPEAVEIAKEHRAHLLVFVGAKEDDDLIERGKLFVKLLSSCCRQENVSGVYTSGVVFQPEFYEAMAEMMREGELPIFNWIWFGLYRTEGGISGYTYGMRTFGREEVEVLDAEAEPDEVRDFLANIVSYQLECDVRLKDGETIGFSQNDRHTISLSEGVALPGMTLKVSYSAAEIWMDDAECHLESIREKSLPVDEIAAYNHMAIYLRWCVEHGLMGDDFMEEHGEQVAGNDLRPFIRDVLGGRLDAGMFNSDGWGFARYYYNYCSELDSPHYPSDIDDHALRYFGPERYNSDEFKTEAYLFIPFDEEYYGDMAEVIGRRYANWKNQEIDPGTRNPSDLAKAMMDYLGCECQYFPSMRDDDPIMSAYGYARRLGVREGYIPVLVKVDEILWECLILNSDPESDGSEDHSFDREKVEEYRESILSAPTGDGRKVLDSMVGQRRLEAEDDDMDWDEEIIGSVQGGEGRDRLASYWNYETQMTDPMILAKIPVKDPWEVFAWLPFGNWNECPDTPELMSAARYWFERYGAVPAAITHDELEFILQEPVPEDEALEVAVDQYGLCPDMDQGHETMGHLADELRQSTVWYFWWD